MDRKCVSAARSLRVLLLGAEASGGQLGVDEVMGLELCEWDSCSALRRDTGAVLSPEPKHADTLIVDFQPPEVRQTFLLFISHPSVVLGYSGPNGRRQPLLTCSFK